jgi:two-component system phosphate regulon response regulator PhoB
VAKLNLLIVEDEPEIAELVELHARREGYDTKIVHSGRVALDSVRSDPPDLLVLDLMLPDVGGLDVCRRMKWEETTRDIPILILSAKGEETDVVTGLELGADDYVTKPFSPRVLMARIKNIARRHTENPAPPSASGSRRIALAGGELVIDAERHKVLVSGEPIELTLTEFGLLHYLAQRTGFVRTRDQIIAAVHGRATVLSSRTIDVHITALRRKLGKFGRIIETVRGVGYRMAEGVPAGEEM